MTTPDVLYLDDLTVGDTYHSAEHSLDADQIIAFAKEFDPQVFHLDDEMAKGTFFQGLAASGWHTASITMKLLVGSIPFGNGVIGAGGQLEWPRATRPDDILHVVSTIIEITPSRSKPDRGMVTVECCTLNQRGETCQRLVAKLVVTRKPE